MQRRSTRVSRVIFRPPVSPPPTIDTIVGGAKIIFCDAIQRELNPREIAVFERARNF